MKNIRSIFLLVGLALCPVLFAQDNPPVTNPPLSTDILTAYRGPLPNGTNTRSSFTLYTLEGMFPPVAGPGIQVAPFGTNTGQFTVSLNLINSPAQALGYYTGVGAGQSVTQLTNKSTTVTMPAACFTGQITMNNASLANGALVKFTVNDSAIANSDVVTAVPQQGSITAAAGYLVTCNSNNGSFVVNVYNAGTTESDAIVLNFITTRASGN